MMSFASSGDLGHHPDHSSAEDDYEVPSTYNHHHGYTHADGTPLVVSHEGIAVDGHHHVLSHAHSLEVQDTHSTEESQAVVAAAAAVHSNPASSTLTLQPWMIPELQHTGIHRSLEFPSAFTPRSASTNLFVPNSHSHSRVDVTAARPLTLPMKRGYDSYYKPISASSRKSRRTSHNATEQRRRSRIKEKIEELRQLVPNPENGLDRKAAILQRAIDYIKELKARCNAYAAALDPHKFQVSLSENDSSEDVRRRRNVMDMSEVRHEGGSESEEDKHEKE